MAAPRRFGPQHAPGPKRPLVECGWKRGGVVTGSDGPIGPYRFRIPLTPGGLLMEGRQDASLGSGKIQTPGVPGVLAFIPPVLGVSARDDDHILRPAAADGHFD